MTCMNTDVLLAVNGIFVLYVALSSIFILNTTILKQ